MIIALPALALAAATPAVEESQLIPGVPLPVPIPLPALPLNLECLLGVTGILGCISNPSPTTLLSDLVGCAPGVILGALGCVALPLP